MWISFVVKETGIQILSFIVISIQALVPLIMERWSSLNWMMNLCRKSEYCSLLTMNVAEYTSRSSLELAKIQFELCICWKWTTQCGPKLNHIILTKWNNKGLSSQSFLILRRSKSQSYFHLSFKAAKLALESSFVIIQSYFDLKLIGTRRWE